MDIVSLSDIADLATIIGVAAALLTAVLGYRGWRHKTGHWLYIPAPNVLSQDPGDPEFWVFPPVRMDDGAYAVVIAGKIMNAGPSDAFSVRVFAEREYEWEEGVQALEAAIDVAVGLQAKGGNRKKIEYAFFEAYKNRQSFIPVLPVGEEQSFVVISRLEPGDAYLDSLLDLAEKWQESHISFHWEINGRQAHGVHVNSRTVLGSRLSFRPDDLCAPFETGRWRLFWERRKGSGDRKA